MRFNQTKLGILTILLLTTWLVSPLGQSFSLGRGPGEESKELSAPSVHVNGRPVAFDQASGMPYIDLNGRTLVPVKQVADTLGIVTTWNGEKRTVTLEKRGRSVVFTIDQATYSIDGQPATMDTAPTIKGGRTYLPLKYAIEPFGADLAWQGEGKRILVTTKQVGVNLSHIHYWSSQWMFVDAMKQSRAWLVQDQAATQWDLAHVKIPLGQTGYPLEIPYEGHQVHTLLFTHMLEDGPLYPGGDYTLLFEGTGEILLDWDAAYQVITDSSKAHKIKVTPSHDGVHLTIKRSDKQDPIRNIRFIAPGHELTYKIKPYHPLFLKSLEPFDVLRFMKVSHVEEFDQVAWNKRPTVNHQTQSDMAIGGLAYEYIVDIGNRTKKDIWITIPYKSSDDYIRQMGLLVKDQLAATRKVYFEYANEPFNFLYPVYDYSLKQGEARGYGKGKEAAYTYAGVRATEVFDILSEVFKDDPDQMVRVISGWSQYPEITASTLSRVEKGSFDALAIAPYFGGERANDIGDGLTFTGEELWQRFDQEIEEEIRTQLKQHKAMAKGFEVDLISYEAGGHFVSLFYPEDKALVARMKAINKDEKMKALYIKYMDLWFDEGGGLFTLFHLIEEPNKYGDFGLMHHYLSDPLPKWEGVMDWIDKNLLPD